MAQAIQPGDLTVQGTLTARQLIAREASITNAMVVGATGIEASKLQHQHEIGRSINTGSGTTAATARAVAHVVKGTTGVLVTFHVAPVTAALGDATVTIELKKNGSTVLSAPISLTSATAAFALLAGTISNTALAAGDVLEVEITAVNAGTGTLPAGVFYRLVLREDAE